jgi:hypothetical protein
MDMTIDEPNMANYTPKTLCTQEFPELPTDFDLPDLDLFDWSLLDELQIPSTIAPLACNVEPRQDIGQTAQYQMDNNVILTSLPKEETCGLQLPKIKYQPRTVMRGDCVDTYFKKPCYEGMTDNATIIHTVSHGNDLDVLAIHNFSNQGPTIKAKSDMALEVKLHVDAAWALIHDFNVYSKADLYRYLALLSDRICVSCNKTSSKLQCMCGSFKCHNCDMRDDANDDHMSNEGLYRWIHAQMPIRHATN